LRRNSDEGALSLKVVSTVEELQQAFAIRSIVFMGEQRCPYNEEFDGNDLVIETDHFTFDPDGMDDHLRMASSVRKKITQRYTLIDESNLRLIITLEDPTFLTRPFIYGFVFARAGDAGPRQRWVNCDAESARREQQFAYPGDKYPDGRQ